MTDHAIFIWGSYGVFAGALIIEMLLLRARAKRTLETLNDEKLAEQYETKT